MEKGHQRILIQALTKYWGIVINETFAGSASSAVDTSINEYLLTVLPRDRDRAAYYPTCLATVGYENVEALQAGLQQDYLDDIFIYLYEDVYDSRHFDLGRSSHLSIFNPNLRS